MKREKKEEEGEERIQNKTAECDTHRHRQIQTSIQAHRHTQEARSWKESQSERE